MARSKQAATSFFGKILIFGAGAVGSSVAEALTTEGNDVVLIDRDESVLSRLESRLDLTTICGDASDPDVIENADIENAGLVLAVTDHDDTNIVICQFAHMMGHTPTIIARLRNPVFVRRRDKLFGTGSEKIGIDEIISPEQLVTDQILLLIDNPGALQIVEFAQRKVRLVAIRAEHTGKLVNCKIEEVRDHMPNVDVRVAAIYRQDRPIIPTGDTVLKANDEVFFIAAPEHITDMMTEMRSIHASRGKRIMLVGAGNIGKRLARGLEPLGYRIKLIEINEQRAKQAAFELLHTTVIRDNAASQDLMIRENIESTEVFCSVTNDDEVNVLSAMMAKKLGARRTMALINNTAYVELLENSTIDIVISPRLATVSELLKHIRKGDIKAVHSLRRGAAEAVEIVAIGSEGESKVVGRTIAELKLPSGATIGAIVRKGKVLMARKDIVIESEDHVIIFVVDKGRKQMTSIQKLFEPSPIYV